MKAQLIGSPREQILVLLQVYEHLPSIVKECPGKLFQLKP